MMAAASWLSVSAWAASSAARLRLALACPALVESSVTSVLSSTAALPRSVCRLAMPSARVIMASGLPVGISILMFCVP